MTHIHTRTHCRRNSTKLKTHRNETVKNNQKFLRVSNREVDEEYRQRDRGEEDLKITT